MNATKFLDTNILMYAYDINEPEKRVIAQQFIEQGWTSLGSTAISLQVLQELQVNLVRRGQTVSSASRIVRDFVEWPIVENTFQIFDSALDLQIRWKTSLWDALIISAAHASGADFLITEDLNHGQMYGRLKVVNPFK